MSGKTKTARPLPVAEAPLATAAVSEDDVRRSNTVNGFEYSRVKTILWTLRLFALLPFFPLFPFYMAKQAKDPAIARNYFKTLGYLLRTAMVHIRHGSIVRMVKYNILYGPEQVKAKIDRRRGACTRCAKCCRQYDCIFLGHDEETKDYYCKIYQTEYWYYGTCGRYPIDQVDIDDHACPGFAFD